MLYQSKIRHSQHFWVNGLTYTKKCKTEYSEKNKSYHALHFTNRKHSILGHFCRFHIYRLVYETFVQGLNTMSYALYSKKHSPLRLTPRCFSRASSISRDPRIIQGVVPQTKRWYLPTCTKLTISEYAQTNATHSQETKLQTEYTSYIEKFKCSKTGAPLSD